MEKQNKIRLDLMAPNFCKAVDQFPYSSFTAGTDSGDWGYDKIMQVLAISK